MQIGDGLIVVNDGNGGWCWVFWPQHGEYVNTTYFLTDDDAADHLQVDALPGKIVDFALTSDGLEPLMLHYASSTLHDPFFTAMFRPLVAARSQDELDQLPVALERFLASEPVMSRTSDDVSLILATERDAALPP